VALNSIQIFMKIFYGHVMEIF